MNRIVVSSVALLLAAAGISPRTAQAARIDLQSSSFRTSVVRGELSGAPFESRTNNSSHPTADYFKSPDGSGRIESRAEADLFRLATLADAGMRGVYRGHSEAYARMELVFNPEVDAIAAITLNFHMSGEYAWGGNQVTLFDLTTATPVWNYFDQGIGGGNIPWNYFAPNSEEGVSACVTVATELFAAHNYRLLMDSWGSSSVPDSDGRTVTVSGLEVQAVPEPSVAALAVLAMGLWRAHRKS